ncbi:MAG: endonuclease/exonuclease/phosphatase family protein [Gammaproteobacteria bacterium]
MRVASYNIHDGVGRDGRFDPARITDILHSLDADLIALQEVTLDHAGDLLERLQSATGLSAIDGSLFARGVGRYGNVVLADPRRVHSNRVHDIAYPGREPRGVIELELGDRDAPLRVYATHLGLRPAERRAQVRGLLRLIDDHAGPALLMGDLNHPWAWPGLRPLRRAGFRHRAVRGFPTRPFPLLALDRIMARAPARIGRCWIERNPRTAQASDHYPLLAEVDWPASR